VNGLSWLGCCLTTEAARTVVQIGSDATVALFYSDSHSQRNHVLGALPLLEKNALSSLPTPALPSYRIPPPAYCMYTNQWYYSEAPLEGVLHAQVCLDQDFCIGLLLHYKTHSRVLGEIRFDKTIGACISEPHWIQYSQERDFSNATSRVRVRLSKEQEDMDEMEGHVLRTMTGWCIWWYGKDKSDITFL
jgi:hypothetical protein